ncbi:MAG: hypothetical protein AAGU27_22170 [Dehalobacterium sp.]
MKYKRFYLLKICIKFFIYMILLVMLFLFMYFYAYSKLRIYGLTITLVCTIGFLYIHVKKLYWILRDIYNMDIREFEGKIHRIEYSAFLNILPCEITLINNKKKSEKYHIFYYNKRLIKNIGDSVLINYLKNSKILIDIKNIDKE